MKYFHDLIKKPIVTEKSTILGEFNKYVFEVSARADKLNVKSAIESIFGVKVKKVNVLNQTGKTKRFRGNVGKRSDKKKALVTLEKDHMIDFSGGVK